MQTLIHWISLHPLTIPQPNVRCSLLIWLRRDQLTSDVQMFRHDPADPLASTNHPRLLFRHDMRQLECPTMKASSIIPMTRTLRTRSPRATQSFGSSRYEDVLKFPKHTDSEAMNWFALNRCQRRRMCKDWKALCTPQLVQTKT